MIIIGILRLRLDLGLRALTDFFLNMHYDVELYTYVL